ESQSPRQGRRPLAPAGVGGPAIGVPDVAPVGGRTGRWFSLVESGPPGGPLGAELPPPAELRPPEPMEDDTPGEVAPMPSDPPPSDSKNQLKSPPKSKSYPLGSVRFTGLLSTNEYRLYDCPK